MRGLWKYLVNINWDDDEDIETCLVKNGIPYVGFCLMCGIGFALNLELEEWGVLALLYLAGIFWFVIEMDAAQKKKRKRLYKKARRWRPPNVYSDNKFVDDERLGGQHK